MNFEIGYGFYHVSKAIVFDLNSLVFVQTMSHRFKSSKCHDSFIASNNLTFEVIKDCLTKNYGLMCLD